MACVFNSTNIKTENFDVEDLLIKEETTARVLNCHENCHMNNQFEGSDQFDGFAERSTLLELLLAPLHETSVCKLKKKDSPKVYIDNEDTLKKDVGNLKLSTIKRMLDTVRLQSKKNTALNSKDSHKNNSNRNLINSSNSQDFLCSVCGKSFQLKASLYIHISTHNVQSKVEKFKCDKSFTTKQKQKKHVCKEEKPLICFECGKTFKLKTRLTRHMLKHETADKKNNICSKTFLKPKKDVTRTQSVTKFKCTVCGEGFSEQNALNTHSLVHTIVKQFACSKCEETFPYEHDLHQHILTHIKAKQNMCGACGKYFPNRYQLARHISNTTRVVKYPGI